ncbi:MAG: hypothetical protein ACFCUO_12770 [Rhodospirillales bacterium]
MRSIALVSGLVLVLAAALAGAVAVHVSAAPEDHCDPAIDPAKYRDRPLGYRPFGDRCEGTYAQSVSASTMRVVSFAAGADRLKPERSEAISIAWPKVKDGPIRLRAKALARNVYYQMDTLQPDGAASFTWKTDVARRSSIGPEGLGVVGWTEAPIGGETETVYLPLTVRQDGGESAEGDYRLLIALGEPLKSVSWSIYRFDERRGAYLPVPAAASQHRAVHRSSRTVPIRIRGLPQTGIYYVEITGELAADDLRTSRRIWFYHPGD